MLGLFSSVSSSSPFEHNSEESYDPSIQVLCNLENLMNFIDKKIDKSNLHFINEYEEREKNLNSTLIQSQFDLEIIKLETNEKFSILIPSSINGYRIIKAIGQGSYSTVQLVTQENTGKLFSAKIFPIDELKKRKETEFATNEKQILSMLNHPNIIKYYDSFSIHNNIDEKEYFVIITEYCENGTLTNYINQNDTDECFIKETFYKISKAIEYLHDQGISHGDIKLDNILLDENLNPKLCDFGFAKNVEISKDSKKYCTVIYAPPELLMHGSYDPKIADIWSLGISLYATKYKKWPFPQGASIRNQILRGKIELDLDDDTQKLIYSCIQKDPKKRATIKDVLNSEYFAFC